MSKYITETTRRDLDWRPHPKGGFYCDELFRSDAYRCLTKTESDILHFAYTRRQYPSRKYKAKKSHGKMDYWRPLNELTFKIPYFGIRDFFNSDGMKRKPPVDSTITKAINKLMAHGFFDIVDQGGHGRGSSSIYRLTQNWRTWRAGDKPVFTKAGLSREKGFCSPESGTFRSSEKLEKGCQLASDTSCELTSINRE